MYLNGRTLTARKITDGTKIWSHTTQDMYDHPAQWGPVSVHGDSVYAPGGMFPERRRVTDGGHTWTSYKAGSGDSAVLVQGTGV
ncbi:hypothetical protein [Streptomyces sp. NPDC004546]|uniref:hypothetical protein n=1 Tax=unclassified Streptomyces TaxID=2593676 RepID=UPI0033AD26DC